MKRCVFMMLCILSISICKARSEADNYYWYKNEKIFLEPGDERYVLFDPDIKSDTSSFIKVGIVSNSSLMWGIQKKSTPITRNIKYISPSFIIANDSSNMYVSERFYVKLKKKEGICKFHSVGRRI